ncbi:MAG: S1 RNA-binding domain-containing protein, partial [Thermoguttaceae bacterium]
MSSDQISSDLSQETQQIADESTKSDSLQRPKVLIGSQRNPEAYRPKPSIPAVDPQAASQPATESTGAEVVTAEAGQTNEGGEQKPQTQTVSQPQVASFKKDSFRSDKFDRKVSGGKPGGKFNGKPGDKTGKGGSPNNPGNSNGSSENNEEDDDYPDHLSNDGFKSFKDVPITTVSRVPVPRIRGKMADDLEEEFSSLFADTEMESLMVNVDEIAGQTLIEPETKLKGKIVSVSSEDVFFDIGGRDQGIVALKQFKELPENGQEWDVIVIKFMQEEGLYELSLPLAAADVREWEQVQEGMILSAKVTAANTGGLECEVNKLRGFIPMSQIAVFRVEKPEDYVGQMLTCVVTEVNPMRRNLVLSRKVMLEREREELREKLLAEL